MTNRDDNNTSPDGGEEQVSDGVPTVPETRDEEPAPLMDASTVAMGRMTDENAPFPQIDGYEIIEAMQAGGQGKLYKARELTPAGREVVLKFPRAGVLSSDRAVALFENEVQKAASLDHPNIARIYSSGLYDRMPFYSMEFIDGLDLGEHVKEANLGQREILELVRTICLAVQHAHQRQIVHRDLKPANIMVTRDGAIPKLLDFGLAIEETELQATIDRGVGTLVYMSPEQAAYELVTTQTDVYSLGVILYELLTGEHPHGFTAQDMRTLTPRQFRDRVANGEAIRPRRVSDRIDKELEALLLKALAHESSDRYASAGDLAADINNYLTGEPLTAKAPTTMYFLRKRLRKYRRQVAIAAAVVIALIGMAVFAYVNVNWERNRALIAEDYAVKAKDDAIEARDAEKAQRLLAGKEANRAGKAEKVALDAQQAESEQRQRVEKEVYRYGISEADRLSRAGMYTDARKLLGTLKPGLRGWEYGHVMSRSVRRDFTNLKTLDVSHGGAYCAAFSPNGKRLAQGHVYGTENTIVIWEMVREMGRVGDELKLKGHTGKVISVAFSRDGKRLASGSLDKTIRIWDAATGKELLKLNGDSLAVTSVAFSPEGDLLVSGGGDRTIKFWDTSGTLLRTSTPHPTVVCSVAFSRDGKRLASGSIDNTIKIWDTASAREVLTLNTTTGVPFAMGERLSMSIAFSPDGKRLASGSWNDTVKIWDAYTGRELFSLNAIRGTEPPIVGRLTACVAFSPDGKYLASGSYDVSINIWDTTTGKELRTLYIPVSGS